MRFAFRPKRPQLFYEANFGMLLLYMIRYLCRNQKPVLNTTINGAKYATVVSCERAKPYATSVQKQVRGNIFPNGQVPVYVM